MTNTIEQSAREWWLKTIMLVDTQTSAAVAQEVGRSEAADQAVEMLAGFHRHMLRGDGSRDGAPAIGGDGEAVSPRSGTDSPEERGPVQQEAPKEDQHPAQQTGEGGLGEDLKEAAEGPYTVEMKASQMATLWEIIGPTDPQQWYPTGSAAKKEADVLNAAYRAGQASHGLLSEPKAGPVVTHLNMDPEASPETKAAVAEMVHAAYAYKPKASQSGGETADEEALQWYLRNATKHLGRTPDEGDIGYLKTVPHGPIQAFIAGAQWKASQGISVEKCMEVVMAWFHHVPGGKDPWADLRSRLNKILSNS